MTTTIEQPPPTPANTSTSAEPHPPTLTWESVLYIVIFCLALALRGWAIDHYPLSAVEAQQSLVAWELHLGHNSSQTTYSPLLTTLQTVTFFMFGASDATARIPSILLGLGLVMLPLALRRQLGAKVSLTASALLAISPTAIYLSRTVNAEIGTAVGTLMLIAGLLNWVQSREDGWMWLWGIGGAVLLTSGSMSFSVILTVALLGLAFMGLFFKFDQARALSWLFDDELDEDNSPELQFNWQQIGLLFGASLVLLATAGTLNLGGLGAMTSFIGHWAEHFVTVDPLLASFNAIFLLGIYEPLLLTFGLLGLVLAVLRNRIQELTWAGWLMLLLLLDLFMVGRPTSHVILPLIPLTFLAAIPLAWLWEGLEEGGTWANEGVLLTTGLIIAVFGYNGLTGWLTRTCGADDQLCQLAWLQAIAAVSLFILVVLAFSYLNDSESALRGTLATVVVLTLLATISFGSRLSYGPLMHLGYQPLAGIPPSTELVELVETLSRESSERVGDLTLLDITALDPLDPALQWQLREFTNLSTDNALQPTTNAVLSNPPPDDDTAPVSEAYVGQSFGLNAIWSLTGLETKTVLEWYLYRHIDQRPLGQQTVLWLRL